MIAVFGGRGMRVAERNRRVVGQAIHRAFEIANAGGRFVVEGAVTDHVRRSAAVGMALPENVEVLAGVRSCEAVELESDDQRSRAHRFYFREKNLVVTGFHSRKS